MSGPTLRDVMMAMAEEVREAVISEVTKDGIISVTGAVIKRAKRANIQSIADRYSKQPEPVNQQMLAALKDCVEDSRQVLAQDEQIYSESYRPHRLEYQRKVVANAEAAIAAAEAAQPVGDKTWFDGYPPFPQDQEWFIAITTYGDRVVLRALDKDYSSYQYTTADHTYIKKESIAHWMQFPDCEYLPPKTPQPASAKTVAQCPNCLGTKRPHALDPEWKGKCECAAQHPVIAAEAAQPAASWPQVDMGFGKFSVGGCVDEASGVPGILYLRLPEARPFNTDCNDLFEIGSRAPAESIATVIHFHTAETLQQTIDVLLELQADHYPKQPASAQPVAQQAEQVSDSESIDFPIAFLTTESGGGKYKLVLSFASLPDLHKGHDRILSTIKHRHPPAVAVPELRKVRRAEDGRPKANYDEGFDHGWNDCVYEMRAMLSAAQKPEGV